MMCSKNKKFSWKSCQEGTAYVTYEIDYGIFFYCRSEVRLSLLIRRIHIRLLYQSRLIELCVVMKNW